MTKRNVNVIRLPTEHQGVHKNSFQKCPCIPGSNWNLVMLAFKARGKPEYLARVADETNPLYTIQRFSFDCNAGYRVPGEKPLGAY